MENLKVRSVLLIWSLRNAIFMLMLKFYHATGKKLTLKQHRRNVGVYISILPSKWLTSPESEYFDSMKEKFSIDLPSVHEGMLFDHVRGLVSKYRFGYWLSVLSASGIPNDTMENLIERIMQAYTWEVDYPVNIRYIKSLIAGCDELPCPCRDSIILNVEQALSL